MTFYYDLDNRSWSIDEADAAPRHSRLAASVGLVVLLGATAAATALQVLGA